MKFPREAAGGEISWHYLRSWQDFIELEFRRPTVLGRTLRKVAKRRLDEALEIWRVHVATVVDLHAAIVRATRVIARAQMGQVAAAWRAWIEESK